MLLSVGPPSERATRTVERMTMSSDVQSTLMVLVVTSAAETVGVLGSTRREEIFGTYNMKMTGCKPSSRIRS